MKRFLSPLDRTLIATLMLALLAWMPAAHAKTQPCKIYGASGLTINVPFGSVAFSYTTTGPVGPPLNQSVSIECPPSVFSGAQDKSRMVVQTSMYGGTYDPATQTWLVPTGDKNLDVQIRLVSSTPSFTPLDRGGKLYDLASLSQSQPDWTGNFSIQLIKKLGNVVANDVPTALADLFNTKDGNQADPALIATVRIGTGTTIRSLSCMASSVIVQLPTVTTQNLASPGAYRGAAPTPVPIQVSGCPTGTRLSVALTGTPPAGYSTSSGVVQSAGTDPNVAVQILNSDITLAPTDISGDFPRNMSSDSDGTISATYYARYYALKPAKGGRVKAGLTFTLSYP